MVLLTCKMFKFLGQRLLFILMLIIFLLFHVTGRAGHLPQDEGKLNPSFFLKSLFDIILIPFVESIINYFAVNVLKEIGKQLGKKNWDFSLNPCDGDVSWKTPRSDQFPSFTNEVNCSCSPDGACHVKNISLKGQDLAGVLPPSLAKLPSIKKIDLSYNYLSGTIPHVWASTTLEFIAVTGNRLSGRVPTFLGNITTLKIFRLENNMFSGKVPPELGKLKSLTLLSLSANNLTGELPMEISSLTNLTELWLSSNYFSGKIPNLGSYTKLEKLDIQGSGLEGPIPASISLLSSLTELGISDLNGEGSSSLFPNLSSMANMKKLMLRSCNIMGTIPNYLSQMTSLKYIDLSFNDLGGDIPDLSRLKLEHMYLTGNSLNGSIPGWLKNGDIDGAIDLSYNSLNETSIPPYCSESLNLFRSYASTNKLDLAKCLPNYCSKDSYSVHINCAGPQVQIGNKLYDGDENPVGPARFRPTIDQWGISNTGSLWNTEDTSDEYVANNVSILSINDSQLYTTARHSPLSVTYYGRCLANGNYTVTLHFAEIVFRDNRSYHGLGRRLFDVYVQGKLKWKDFDIKKEAGGIDRAVIKVIENVNVFNKTLEIRLQYAGKGTTAVPVRGLYGPLISAISMESEFKPPSHGNHITITIIVVVATILLLILIVLGIAWQRGYMGNQISRERDLKGLDLQTGVFTYKQIKAATDNFSDLNKLGEGGFGSVYKGTLLDGTLIAVKKLSSKSKQGNREFVNEIGMIAGIQHPNVVKLHGCCAEHNKLLLVYDYMENNSLAHALFEKENAIDWNTRHRICIGIAKGLTFLHEETALKMVHRDIKATNVLLDTDLTPKISDFGLAKLNEEENTHISTRVAGTLGYMAPEYALWGYLTFKADVYSFGVLALEIVAGKNNLQYRANEDYFCLLDWAIVLKEKGSLIDFVDPRLGSNFNKKEAVRMMNIALLCTNQSPALRPTMSEVVNMLKGRMKIHEPDMNLITSEDDFKIQALRGKNEEMQHESVIEQSSSSLSDMYTNTHAFEESRVTIK